MPGGPGDITVIYRALSDGEVILRDELEAARQRRGARSTTWSATTASAAGALLSPEHLRALVPDIARARRLRLRAAGDGRRDAREP